jgi:hypothetical protein
MHFQVKQYHQDNAGSDEKHGTPEALWGKPMSLRILLRRISVPTKQNKIFNSGHFLFRVNFYVQIKSWILL